MKNRNIIYAPDTKAATIFDKHTSGLSELVGESYLADAPGEVIAFPGKPLAENISKGDIIINRALGEGNLAFRHIVVNNKIQEGRKGGGKYIRVESLNGEPQWVKIATREGIVKPNILIFKSKLSADTAIESDALIVDSFINDIEFDELYDDELQEIMDFQPSEVITPLPVPTSRPVPFASPPPSGSYWPLVSNHRRSKEVAFQYSTSGTYHQKFIGNASRRFLASRKKGARYHVGIDLYANHRDKVIACEDGKIINFYHFYHGAYALIVEHENIVINYGEVDRNSLRANGLRIGSEVKAGQVIGMVGKMESSSMLHFETYRKGTRINLRWYKSKQAPSLLLNPTKYLLYLKTQGKIASPSGWGGAVIPPVRPNIDISSATDYNGRKSVELGWINRLSDINRYFNLPLDSPANSAALARAVYPYQIQKGMTGRDVDGKIGQGTWRLLQNDIQNSAPPSINIDISSATDYNGRKSVELGWINRLSDINRYFNLPLDSPANSAALARAVYPYQIQKGMTGRDVDGKIGQGTWRLLQNDIQNSAPPSINIDISSATDYNGRKSVELGWINRLSDINRYFNLPLDSPANSTALARAVYPYQIQKGMTGRDVDGKIGPGTWAILQADIGRATPIPTPPTPTPTSGLAANMARIAISEWNDWGRGTRREDEPAMFGKLKQYYLATKQVNQSNVDNVARRGATGRSAWSAAFISYVVKTAGGGNHFIYTWQHWQYIVQAKQNRTANRTENPFWLYSSTDTKPEVGDIICNWRGSRQLTYDNVQDAAPYPSTDRSTHCDIVTEIDLETGNLYKIGGNKSDSVNRQRIRLNAQGYIENTSRYFAIIKIKKAKTCCTEDIKKSQLKTIFSAANDDILNEMVNVFNEASDKFFLNSCLRRAHFFAQLRAEVGNSIRTYSENMNYSEKRLKEVFKYFRERPAEARQYGRNTAHGADRQAIANRAYANRLGNGNIASGDGWRYRGKGFIQLTGRSNYEGVQREIDRRFASSGIDIIRNGDDILTTRGALISAMGYWSMNNLHLKADKGDTPETVDTITKVINKYTDSYDKRKRYFLTTKTVFDTASCGANKGRGRK